MRTSTKENIIVLFTVWCIAAFLTYLLIGIIGPERCYVLKAIPQDDFGELDWMGDPISGTKTYMEFELGESTLTLPSDYTYEIKLNPDNKRLILISTKL